MGLHKVCFAKDAGLGREALDLTTGITKKIMLGFVEGDKRTKEFDRSSFFLFSFFTKILSTEFQTKMYCI